MASRAAFLLRDPRAINRHCEARCTFCVTSSLVHMCQILCNIWLPKNTLNHVSSPHSGRGGRRDPGTLSSSYIDGICFLHN